MSQNLIVKRQFRIRKTRQDRLIVEGSAGSTPRISRLMALAISFDQSIREGAVADQAELACLGHVSRARLTQIMNLLNLAPEIQEDILSMTFAVRGRDPISERHVRPIAATPSWKQQKSAWATVRGTRASAF
jgi:hypothetical protein